MPCYLSGSSDGAVKLWHFDQEQALWSFSSGTGAKITSIRFQHYGNVFGVANTMGEIQLWKFLSGSENESPFGIIKVSFQICFFFNLIYIYNLSLGAFEAN